MRPFKFNPALDLSESRHTRYRSIRRESGHLAWMSQLITSMGFRLYLRVYHRYSIEGLHHVPRETPFILIANHTSHLDTIVLTSLIPVRLRTRVYPLAAADSFFQSRPRALLLTSALNILQLRRRSSNRHALQDLRERLLQGDIALIIYPEGTRGNGQQLGPFKPGIGNLVAATSIPVIPCLLTGCAESLSKGSTLPRPSRITVQIGAPIHFSEFLNERESWQRIATRLFESLDGMKKTAC
jgi:1-acyl-sn-glycerol-3-phosphate acyltransferase